MTFETYTQELEDLMRKELDLIHLFSGIEEQIKVILVRKEWPLLEMKIREMKKLADSIAVVESRRDSAYQAMKLYCRDEEIRSFYLFIAMFCPERKEVLSTLYRELKTGVMKVKNTTIRIETYINTVVSTVDRVLDEVYPMRRGTIYDMSGSSRQVIHQPMVLDREL